MDNDANISPVTSVLRLRWRTYRDGRRATADLALELAQFNTPSERNELGAIMDRHTPEETAEIRAILDRRDVRVAAR